MSDLNEIERGQLCQSTIESLYEATGGLKQLDVDRTEAPDALAGFIQCTNTWMAVFHVSRKASRGE